jgi:hypothetical protein
MRQIAEYLTNCLRGDPFTQIIINSTYIGSIICDLDLDAHYLHRYNISLSYANHRFAINCDYTSLCTTHKVLSSKGKVITFQFGDNEHDKIDYVGISCRIRTFSGHDYSHKVKKSIKRKLRRCVSINRMIISLSDKFFISVEPQLKNNADSIDFVSKLFKSIMCNHPHDTVKLLRTHKK